MTRLAVAHCWGWNGHSQLGSGTGDAHVPRAVSGDLNFVTVAAGHHHACGITVSGLAYCWGSNDIGQLGTGSADPVMPEPAPVAGGHRFREIAPGGAHTCGLTASDELYCWGEAQRTPQRVAIPGLVALNGLDAGRNHTCALAGDGSAYCWGYNGLGQLGNGSTGSNATPAPVSGNLTFRLVTTGGEHTCGLTTAGVRYCWGRNANGELGDGTQTGSLVPVPVLSF